MGLTAIDWTIMAVYFMFVLGIGVALKRYTKTSADFFLAGRSIPAWVCMGLDIRLPIGLFFSLIGLLLIGFSALGDQGTYGRALGLNVNLTWGGVLLVFGITMGIFGNRRRTPRLSAQPPSENHNAEDSRP